MEFKPLKNNPISIIIYKLPINNIVKNTEIVLVYMQVIGTFVQSQYALSIITLILLHNLKLIII